MVERRRKVFITYHKEDQDEVNNFIQNFSDDKSIFIKRILSMTDDIINSNDSKYVMSQIRRKFLQDSTVTIIMIGKCTWARRYVDWEIKSSLRQGDNYLPNGLLGILLPSVGSKAIPPERLKVNLPKENGTDGYARWYVYPKRKDQLITWIEDAFQARTTRTHLIANSSTMFKNNRTCN